jgi:secreted trypsin-like serine protease
MRKLPRSFAVVVLAVAALFAAVAPASSVTGGEEDTDNDFPYVGMAVFYQPDGRFRCSGTLIAPRVFLTAAHCTYLDIGKVVVTFDWEISRTEPESEINIPRAADDSGPDDAVSAIGFTAADISAPKYVGEPTYVLGTAYTHPQYSDFTDLKNWNDTGVIILDSAVALPTAPLAPENYLNAFRPPLLRTTIFTSIGYGTEVRQAEEPPRPPTPERQPIVRRWTTEIGQKLTAQVLQTNGNDQDPFAGGGTCFGDSGGPILLNGYVVGDTSYGFTNNCRYIDGYQRVDIPVVRNWVLSCVAALTCETKPAPPE